ncbi:MAG: alpha/beta fold hydrolase, partial [Phycisphaerae bacterium]
EEWRMVQEGVGRFARAVAYERAGMGKSAAVGGVRDAATIARELHAALVSVGLKPPYVLVGHSMGGVYVRVFAGMYPSEVSGMVLVDPTQGDMYEPMEAVKGWFAAHRPGDWGRVEEACAGMPAELRGLDWTFGVTAKHVEEYVETLPKAERERMRAAWWEVVEKEKDRQLPKHLSAGAVAEFAAGTLSVQEAMRAKLPRVKIVLLSARPSLGVGEVVSGLRPLWRDFDREMKRRKRAEDERWVKATPGAELVVAEGDGHGIPEEDPGLVVEVVRRVAGM